MAALGAGQIARMVAALIEGNDNLIEKLVAKKFEDVGEEIVRRYLGGPLAVAQRVDRAIESGGRTEFDRMRHAFLHQIQQGPMPYQSIVHQAQSILGHPGPYAGRDRKGRAAWARSSWATSRDDWLDNHWRHDWRTQPRDSKGRWIPGRLDYVPVYLQYRGMKMGRKRRRTTRLKRLARMRGRRFARQLMK